MIQLEVDEAYAFDYLSILQVKMSLSDANIKNFTECKQHLINQLGVDLVEAICSSQHYFDLVKVNKLVFDQIERIRNGATLDAREVDDANMLRFKFKKALQREFFDTDLAEQKTKEV